MTCGIRPATLYLCQRHLVCEAWYEGIVGLAWLKGEVQQPCPNCNHLQVWEETKDGSMPCGILFLLNNCIRVCGLCCADNVNYQLAIRNQYASSEQGFIFACFRAGVVLQFVLSLKASGQKGGSLFECAVSGSFACTCLKRCAQCMHSSPPAPYHACANSFSSR